MVPACMPLAGLCPEQRVAAVSSGTTCWLVTSRPASVSHDKHPEPDSEKPPRTKF